jgi:hypothetical protein
MSGDSLLLDSLLGFYEDDHYAKELIEVLDGTKNISLRSIDWFITNYSKKMNVYYQVYEVGEYPSLMMGQGGVFLGNLNVHQSYKSQLKSYSKKTFDPFCRRGRIAVEVGDQSVETTIGQLNFFRWALQNGVIEYIDGHKGEVEEDMNECLRKIKVSSENKGTHKRKKREELSLSATRGLSKTNVGIQLVFD